MTLLDAAFALVEDDVDAVVAAAEGALPALAPLVRPAAEPATAAAALAEPLARLAASEEEEVRASAARLAGTLAAPLGRALAEAHLLPIALAAAADASFRVRKAAAAALASLAPVAGPGAVCDRILPALAALSRDAVWTVRKAAVEVIPRAASAAPTPPRAAAAAVADAFPRLCEDAGPWVRNAALCALGPAICVLAASANVVPPDLLSGHYAAAAAGDETAAATAEHFTAVAVALGAARWPALAGAFEALAHSPDRTIRSAAVAALPSLARLLGPERAAAALEETFAAALKDSAPEVVLAALRCALEFVAALPERRRSAALLPALCALSAPPSPPGDAACARLSASGGSGGGAARRDAALCGAWRVREAAARAMDPFVAAEAAASPARGALAAETLLPSALEALQDPVAAVRHAAAAALAPLLVAAGPAAAATAASDELADACAALRRIATSGNYLQRHAFVAACDALAARAAGAAGAGDGDAHARRLLQNELVPMLLSLSEDPVPSVRCAVGAALGRRFASGRAEAAGLGAGSEARSVLARLACDGDAETRRAARDGSEAAHAGAQLPRAKMPLKVGLLQRRGLGSGLTGAPAQPPLRPVMPSQGRAASAAEGSGSAPEQPLRVASPRELPDSLRPVLPRRSATGAPVVAGAPRAAAPPLRGVRPPLLPGLLQRRTASGGSLAGSEDDRQGEGDTHNGSSGGGGEVSQESPLASMVRRLALERGSVLAPLPPPRARAGSSY